MRTIKQAKALSGCYTVDGYGPGAAGAVFSKHKLFGCAGSGELYIATKAAIIVADWNRLARRVSSVPLVEQLQLFLNF